MNETTNTLTKNMVGGICTIELYGWVFDLRWAVGLLIALMIADLISGVHESRKRNIKIPKSKCIRRTLNKICDYSAVMMVFLFLGGLLLNQPVAGLLVGITISCIAEICSVLGHVFFLKGISVKFSLKHLGIFLFKIFVTLVKCKNQELGNAFEKVIKVESIKEKDNETNK